MGQEQSSPVDENIPSQTLKDRSIDSVAQHIKDGSAKNIVVMVRSCISGYFCTRCLADAVPHLTDRSGLG